MEYYTISMQRDTIRHENNGPLPMEGPLSVNHFKRFIL